MLPCQLQSKCRDRHLLALLTVKNARDFMRLGEKERTEEPIATKVKADDQGHFPGRPLSFACYARKFGKACSMPEKSRIFRRSSEGLSFR